MISIKPPLSTPSRETGYPRGRDGSLPPEGYVFSVAAGILPAVEPGILPGGMGVWIEKSLPFRTSGPGGKMPPSTAAKKAAATDVNPTLNTYDAEQSTRDAPASRTADVRLKLESLVFNTSTSRKARLHALWALIGGGPMEASFHQRLLADDDATVRAWAVRAAGNIGNVTALIRERVTTLGHDTSHDGQLQVAIASRKIAGCDALPVLVDVLANCGQDKLIPAIVWQNLHSLLETESARFASLLGAESEGRRLANSTNPAGRPGAGATRAVGTLAPAVERLLPRVIDRMLSARNPNAPAIAALLEHTVQVAAGRAPECIAAVSAKIEGLNEAKLAALRDRLRPLLEGILSDDRS